MIIHDLEFQNVFEMKLFQNYLMLPSWSGSLVNLLHFIPFPTTIM